MRIPVSLQTQRPWTVSVFPRERIQHAVSTFWFSSFDNNLTSPVWLTRGVMIFIPYAVWTLPKWELVFILLPLPSFIFQKVILWQSSSYTAPSESALSWTQAMFCFCFFPHKSLPISIKSWQGMAPPFLLLSLDKARPHKRKGALRLKVTLMCWQAGDSYEFWQKQKPNSVNSAISSMQNMLEKATVKAPYVTWNFHKIMINSRRRLL